MHKIFALNINGFIPLDFTGTHTQKSTSSIFWSHGFYLFEYEKKIFFSYAYEKISSSPSSDKDFS
jgi:hypothetical protein